MGILAHPKQYLAKKITAAAGQVADGIAAASKLSPRQIAEIEEKRQQYLAQKPDMTGEQAQAVVKRNLGAVGIEVYQEYLAQLKTFYHPVQLAAVNFDSLNRIRYFDITKWVSFSDEKYIDKLVSVYQVLSAENCNIALIYHRTKERCQVALAVANTDTDQSDPAEADAYINRISRALKGNFPGAEIRTPDDSGCGTPACLLSAIKVGEKGPEAKSVATVSNLPSEKSKDFISQSMEKLLDGNAPRTDDEAYTVVLLASPVLKPYEKKNRLLGIETELSPYESWQTNYTYTSSDSQNSSATAGVHLGANAGANAAVGYTKGYSKKVLEEDSAEAVPTGQTTKVKGVGGKLKSIGKAVEEGLGWMARPTETETNSMNSGFQAGINFGVQFSRASSISVQQGMNEGVIQTFTNYSVQHTLKVIESQVKRLDESTALGMWDFAAYVVSENPGVARDVAHTYFALTQGEESYMTTAAIHLWDGRQEKESALCILESLQKIQHPVFALAPSADTDRLMYPTLVTPSACITGRELARALNLPRKSVSGLPVLESVPFGREVIRHESAENPAREIVMGRIQHMGQTEGTPVTLDVDSLTSHVFITGSTGSGKSNTIYQMLDKLRAQGVKFLVVEPAKGEYKKVFGGTSRVYGTNPTISDLLCINPFSFPDKIAVTEHIDRLIEIFNACWPMYAAMPAILKDAVEKSYEKVGWDIGRNRCEPKCFPTFADLIDILPRIMASSFYSGDTKSDYSGALVTRVQSMTNGITGQIFCGKRELSFEDLFEQDVIVDLSRVPSAETKSLMMGVIVMKLQEYRMSLDRTNEKLVHVTILEEAHNLLRKTSIVQTQESSNLHGQSVKMLTDSIAEMRTYGEGFIIADQAPGLLDESVIRNTNTKIVLRLPELEDRKTVGASMALSDEQITELAKLPKGTAAIYQSDWLEPVLCQIDRFADSKVMPLQYVPPKERDDRPALVHFFRKAFDLEDPYELTQEDVDTIREWITGLRKKNAKPLLNSVLAGCKLTKEQQTVIAYNIFGGADILQLLEEEPEEKRGIERVNRKISSYHALNDAEITESVRRLVMQEIFRDGQNKALAMRYQDFLNEGRVR